MTKSCILLFVKYPETGKVKTRLASELGEDITIVLYRNFVEDIFAVVNDIRAEKKICYHPSNLRERFVEWLGNNHDYIPQDGENLGERMENSFAQVFREGYSSAVLIGSDSPDLPADVVKLGLSALRKYDVVIGPSQDGGYYLIGFSRDGFMPELFRGITWSTGTVFQETIDIVSSTDLKVFILPEWGDVDTLDDLKNLIRRNKNTWFSSSKTVACLRDVIINSNSS